MGRSGGGGGGHHGGGGGFSHRSGGHHYGGGGYHHHGGGGYYSGGGNCNICAIPIFIILVIVMVIIILVASPTVTKKTTMSICEQVIACPSSLGGDNTIEFRSSSSHVTAYLMKKEPSINKGDTSVLTVGSQSVKSDHYIYNSFNLVKGSTIHWEVYGDQYFHFYLIDGEKQFNKFTDYDTFHYVKDDYARGTFGHYTVQDSDEYFAVIDCPYYTYLSSINYTVDHYRYDVTGSLEKSSSSHTFHVSDDLVPGACLIADMPCSPSAPDTDISIIYDLDRGTVFYVCLALAIIFGVSILGAIALCVFCAIKKKKGTTGTTIQSGATTTNPYQPVNATPAYPASYQQPQPPAAYNPGAPVYPTAGGGVDPVPAYAPDYGTAGTSPYAAAY